MRAKDFFSLKYLLAIGFVCAMIPLVVAVVYAAFAMQETAELSEKAIYQVVEQTKTTRSVLQKVGDVERKAKLFVLLADPVVRQPYERESYESVRASLKQSLQELLKSGGDNRMVLLANELAEKEKLIYEQIIGSEKDDQVRLPVDEAFQGLHDAAAALWQEVAIRVDRKVSELHDHTRSAQQALFLKGALLMTVSIGFAVGLLAVLGGAIRQLDEAIRRLGGGDLGRPVNIDGPKDLGFLGERLEWLRARLMALEESKQQFMRNVSQELEAPLAEIGLSLETLTAAEDAASGEAAQNAATQRLTENVHKLQELFGELRHYNRVNENAAPEGKRSIDIKALLAMIIEENRERLDANSLSVKQLVQPVDLVGDAGQMRTVIEELLSNAIEYSPVRGEIRIILRSSGGEMELEVEDDGPGIPEDERARVFEPFYRGRTAKEIGGNGSGMGLAIVAECVANHQGQAEVVEPRLDQQGARIRVRIPLTEVA